MNPSFPVGPIAIVACYALGCLTPGYWWARWTSGRDLRVEGSGSVGARNAARVLGKRAGLAVFLLDAAKGAGAVGISHALLLTPLWSVVALLAVVCGHIWPAPLGFKGGKGMATALGALAVFDPFLLAVCLATFGALWLTLRHFMRAGMLSVVVLPLAALLLGRSSLVLSGYLLLALLLLWAHRANLAALYATKPTTES